jgi:Flp pilus assembly protein TadB
LPCFATIKILYNYIQEPGKEAAMPNQEDERLRRLRDRQLADRDPLVKQRQFQRDSSAREIRARTPFSLTRAWGDLPHIVKVPFYGLLLGVVVILVLPILWISTWALLAGAAVTVVFMAFGAIVGSAMDLRDDIRNGLK